MKILINKFLLVFLFFVSFQAFATVIPPNTVLYRGQSVTSENGKYILAMQNDGNLVLYRNDGAVRFSTYTFGAFVAMQIDGNFVEYTSTGQALWSTETYSNPGAYANVQNDGNFVIYSSGNVPLWGIGPDAGNGVNPSQSGDVVGRDLDYPVIGLFGHVGIWDGGVVYEAISGPANAIRYVSLSSFANTSPYWGTAAANIPAYSVYACFEPRCTNFDMKPNGQKEVVGTRVAIAKRMYQVMLIGADYTLTAYATPADPGGYFQPARRGIYRCDSFVIDVLGITVENQNSEATWRSRYVDLRDGGRLPRIIFNKLLTYQ